MRCPHCGATNAETAQWCTQCYRRFDEPVPPPDVVTTPDDDAVPVEQAGAGDETAIPVEAPETTEPAQPPAAVDRAGFRREGEELQWQCVTCNSFNAMEATICAVCGAAFADRFRDDTPEPPRNWGQALALSAIVPGAGHIAVGRYGSGVARLVLFVTWLLGAVVLGNAAGARGIAVVTPLMIGVLILWIGTIVDVYRLQQGDTELLTGRHLLWLVVAVLVLLGMGLFASLSGART